MRTKDSVPYGAIFRSTVKERFLPAFLLIAAAIGAIQFLPGFGFFAVLQIVIFLSLLEFYNLFGNSVGLSYKLLGLAVALAISATFLFDGMPFEMALLFFLFLAAVFPLFVKKQEGGLSLYAGAVSLALLGPVYIGLTLNYIYLLREERGPFFIYFLIVIIVFGDTGAYFAGKFWGKHRLAPKISPNKTWAGAIAGLACAAAGAILTQAVLIPQMILWKAVLVAVPVHTVAQISDLLESLFKRSAGKKDSSNILGGHGGFLDRVDSFILAAPFFFYLLKIVRLV